MKILVLSFYFEPDLCAGSFRTTSLVNELKSLDVTLDVITTKPNRYSSMAVDAKEKECIGNVTIERIDIPSHNSGMLDQIRSFLTFYSKAIKLVRNKEYDLVYATSSRLFTAFLGRRIAHKKRIPLYLDIRDIFVDTLSDVLPTWLFRISQPFLSAIERYTFNGADHINLVSKGFENYFATKFKCPSYSFYTNGVDDGFLCKDYSSDNQETINVLYAGNIGEGQGLNTIIPGLSKEFPDYTFTVIGDGGRKNQLADACVNLPNVKLRQPVKREELYDEYKNASVLFLHLNDYAAFEKVLPSKLFEYGATGKPILAGVSGYAKEFIESELVNAETFPPSDVEKASSALRDLKLSHTERDDFIQKYRRKFIMSDLAKSIYNLRS